MPEKEEKKSKSSKERGRSATPKKEKEKEKEKDERDKDKKSSKDKDKDKSRAASPRPAPPPPKKKDSERSNGSSRSATPKRSSKEDTDKGKVKKKKETPYPEPPSPPTADKDKDKKKAKKDVDLEAGGGVGNAEMGMSKSKKNGTSKNVPPPPRKKEYVESESEEEEEEEDAQRAAKNKGKVADKTKGTGKEDKKGKKGKKEVLSSDEDPDLTDEEVEKEKVKRDRLKRHLSFGGIYGREGELESESGRGLSDRFGRPTMPSFGKTIGGCTKLLIRYCGTGCTTWLMRRRFVLFRIIICIAYFMIGVEYYHAKEGWTRTDAVYFITVSTTTVGYGDLHPTNDATRLFTTIYVIIGLAVVLSSANDVIQYFVVKKFQQKVLTAIDWCVKIWYSKCLKKEVKGSSLESKAWFKLVFSLSCVVALVFFGTTFYATNEKLSLIQGLYWTMMTMLTVGYGDLSLTQDSTRVFSTWFIWLCVIIYIMALTNIFDTFEELKSEALRLEILKQHAIDIVDVLDEEGRKRKNTADKGILSGMGQGGAFELFSVIKDGVTGAEERGEGYSGKRRKSIHSIRKSISAGTFQMDNPMATATRNNKKGGDDIYSDVPVPPPARPSVRPADKDLAQQADDEEHARDLEERSKSVSNLISKDQVLEKAREDRFVLEMLQKMNKVKYEREVEPLIVHFHKLEKLRGITGNRADMERELFDDKSGGGLLGLASSFIGTKKAVVRRRASNFQNFQYQQEEKNALETLSRARSSLMPSSSLNERRGTGQPGGNNITIGRRVPPPPGAPG